MTSQAQPAGGDPPGPRPWRALVAVLRGERRRLACGLGVSVLQALTTLPVAWLIWQVFDRAEGRGTGPGVGVSVAALLGLTVLTSALGAGGQWLIHRAIKQSVARFRAELLARILTLPKAVHDTRERARFHDLAVQDTERVEALLSAVAGQLLPNGLVALVLAGVLLVRSPALCGILLVALPIHYFVSRRSLARFQAACAEVRVAFGGFSRGVNYGLRGLELIWFQGGLDRELKGHTQRAAAWAQAGWRSAWRWAVHQRMQQAMYITITAAVLLVGSRAVRQGTLTTGELLSLYTLVALTLNYVRDAGQGIGAVVVGREAWLALHAFRSAEHEPPYRGTRRMVLRGELALGGVSFGYTTPGREREVLHGLHLRLVPGRMVVLTGPNGGGKSTLLSVLLGLYRPTAGIVRADGVPYEELDLADLRRQIGVVPQDPLLISGTVRDNLAYGRPEATDADLVAAARTAQAHEFIHGLPAGYDTVVGENGVWLSGGQRQRLALARACLTRPRALILDEPTNHVDQAGVQEWLVGLRTLDPAPALLVVSHLPAVAELADEVWSLEDGRLVPVPRSAVREARGSS